MIPSLITSTTKSKPYIAQAFYFYNKGGYKET